VSSFGQIQLAAPAARGPGRETRRLRVLTLTPFYPSADDGSQGGFVAEPLMRMDRDEIENQVIAVTPFYRARVHAPGGAVSCDWETYFSFPGNFGLPSAGAFLAAGLLKSMRRLKPFDLIHSHGALPCGHAAMLLRKKLGIPFVVSLHGLDVFLENQAGPGARSWCKRVSERVYRSSRRLICISEKVREQLGDIGRSADVIYNGVDAEMFCPGAEMKSPLTVLSVGNLIPIKGHALLLRAFARLSDVVPECAVEIFGDGPERCNLAQMAEELGIRERVTFRGRQSRKTIAEAMRRCAVFALPSRYEGLGCVYLEAMASGKAAIGCRGQGIEEIIEHGKNGFLVGTDDAEELSEVMRALLQNEGLRRRVGESARRAILQRYTLADQAGRLTHLYRECAS